MKFNKSVLMALGIAVVFFGQLFCMPGVGDTGVATKLDSHIRADLNGIGAYYMVGDKLSVLNSILGYANGQTISESVQTEYYDAVKRFDMFARAYNLSKADIAQLDKFFKILQGSTLMFSGASSDLSSKINYWTNRARRVGLTPYKRALQRQRSR